MKIWAKTVILAGVAALLAVTACELPSEVGVKETETFDKNDPANPSNPANPANPVKPGTPGQSHAISITPSDLGTIECSRKSAAVGTEVRVNLYPVDFMIHRYREGTLSITPDCELTYVRSDKVYGAAEWSFIMPAEPVSITAVFEERPIHIVTIYNDSGNGTFAVIEKHQLKPHYYEGREGAPVEGGGWVATEAREDIPFVFRTKPDAGYKLMKSGVTVMPTDAIPSLHKLTHSDFSWNFTMGDTDLEIRVNFTELEPLEMYKGGIRRGVSVGELSDDSKYFPDSICLESEEIGHEGNPRAIKVSPALNENGNAVRQSFGLFFDTEIDMSGVVGVSFSVKSEGKVNLYYAGFGDADPNKRVVYAGRNNNQSISVLEEWTRYVIPVPVPQNGLAATRCFFLSALIQKGGYLLIDDIELLQSGVSLESINILDYNSNYISGVDDAAKMLNGARIRLNYDIDYSSSYMLQSANTDYALYYNLAHWLKPYIEARIENMYYTGGTLVASININGVRSNEMRAYIYERVLLDDFEDFESIENIPIPAAPSSEKGYLWHSYGGSPKVVSRSYCYGDEHNEIYSGVHAGSWRPNAEQSSKTRGGRNFEQPKDATFRHTLYFSIKVTVGGGNTVPVGNTVFTFELKNGGTPTDKTSGTFYAQEFTHDIDDDIHYYNGWQHVSIPLADYAAQGMDLSAITGYAFGVVDNQGSALRIMLDDICIY